MISVDIKKISLLKNNNETVICESIKFNIKPGDVSVIIGKNGSGKSTLLKGITNLLPEYKYKIEGTSVFNGINLFECESKDLLSIRKHKIKYVFQDSINSFDPLKKIKYYFELNNLFPKNVNELLKYFYLPEYSEISKMYNYELSGGMAQRLSFVLALAVNPNLILMDEPTSGIDYAFANLFKLKMKEFTAKNNSSIILVTHDYKFADKVGDSIYLLENKTLNHINNKEEYFSLNYIK